jgi:hypothetical protein
MDTSSEARGAPPARRAQHTGWMFRRGLFTAKLAILGHDYFESVQQVETHLEHINIVIVVLDIQNSGHETPSGTFSG